MKPPTFVDRVRIEVRAGRGGHGVCSFRREKFVPRGGPDGGDGGRGGHVILEASPHENSLLSLFYQPIQRAVHGGSGRGQRQHGRDGADRIVRVPCGTEVRDEAGAVLADLVAPGQRFRAARGGRGGLGNARFATSVRQAPRECTPGEDGEERHLWLELKLIAEAGLVGFPNAGKSTLLRRISRARPKVAPYPFTTLHPVIGTVLLDDERTWRVADIPGLLSGAHRGVGLGHAFLRHIERTRLLVFVVDLSGADGRDPADDYACLLEELRQHGAGLADRPRLVAANKLDLPDAEARLPEFRRRTGTAPIAISAQTGRGIEALLTAFRAEADRTETPPPP